MHRNFPVTPSCQRFSKGLRPFARAAHSGF